MESGHQWHRNTLGQPGRAAVLGATDPRRRRTPRPTHDEHYRRLKSGFPLPYARVVRTRSASRRRNCRRSGLVEASCHHRDGVGRDDRRWRAVPLGPTALGLARSRAPTTLERRQGQAVRVPTDICSRGGPQTSCWSPWPIRQPASPGHCSGTSVSTNRCPLNKLESGSAGMAISGACSCMVRERCCAGAAPSRVRVPAGPTNCWRGGPQTSCWSPWPIRQPASPGHCSGTSVSTNRCPLNKLESGHQLARVRRFDGETGQHPRSAKPEALSEHQAR